jgi:hypothetical protein
VHMYFDAGQWEEAHKVRERPFYWLLIYALLRGVHSLSAVAAAIGHAPKAAEI